MFELVLTVSIVVFLSALCSLFEATLYAVPTAHIETLLQTEHRSGRILRALKERIDEPITAILSLNTISNTAGAAIAGFLAARELGDRNVIYFSAFFTFLILFFAEVIPKTVGVVYARPLASVTAMPIQALVVAFKPVTVLVGFVTGAIRRRGSDEEVSGEHLVALAKLGHRIGTIERDEAAVIENIVALDTKMARDVLTPRTVLFALREDETVGEVWQDRGIRRHTRVPIYKDTLDQVTGIVHRADVLAAVAEDRKDATLKSLAKPMHFVHETIHLDRLLKDFLKRGQHMFAVVDEYGGLEGVVTLEDVLEEILGQEIVDEYDEVHDMQELARQRASERHPDIESGADDS